MKHTLFKLALCFFTLVPAGSILAQTQVIRAFSHRGGRMERDENTLKAFQESWDAGYTGFETDVRMTKDAVEKLTRKQIEQLRTKKGNKIMKLEEFVQFLNGKDNLYVEWEFKTMPQKLYPQKRLEEYVEKVYQAAKSVKTKSSQFVFTSSDYRGLRYLQTHHPDAELLLIISKPLNDETIAMAKLTGIKTLGCKMEGTSRQMVEKAHKEGITVSLWPGQSVEDFMLGAYLGCDRMCTDVPLTVKKWVKKNAPWLKVIY